MPDRTALHADKLRLLALMREQAGIHDASARIGRRADRSTHPLSPSQEGLWFLDRMLPGTAAYNVPLPILIRGELDVTSLECAITEVCRRHEVLRMAYPAVQGLPAARVLEPEPIRLPVSEAPGAEEEALRRIANREAGRPFDVEQGPLFRAALVRMDGRRHLLLVTVHHLVFDGWSITVFLNEVAALYQAFRGGSASPLPELEIDYADYADWKRRQQGTAQHRKDLEFWLDRLSNSSPGFSLSTLARPRTQGPRGSHETLLLPLGLDERLARFGRLCAATPFMTMLAAFQVLLGRYSGQEDILVGTPVSGRAPHQLDNLIGCFVNTVVLRGDLSGDPTCRELASRTKATAVSAFAHQELPFENLARALGPQRNGSGTPVFQVMITFQDTPFPSLAIPGLELQPLELDPGFSKFDLLLHLVKRSDGWTAAMEYQTDLFDAPTVRRMLEGFENILEGMVAQPDCRISELPAIGAEDLRRLLVDWNGRPDSQAACPGLPELFERQARRRGGETALVCDGRRMSYSELNARANRLAHYLRQLGIGADRAVALYLDRSFDMVVGILGVLKAGGYYVPLELDYPASRLEFILRDTAPRVIITQCNLTLPFRPEQATLVMLDESDDIPARFSDADPASVVTGSNLAYAIYTSGSTGQPKGVLVTHSNVVRLFEATRTEYQFGIDDVWALFHSYAFDVSVWEIWGALLFGGKLVIVPYWVCRSPRDLYQLLCAEGVTILNQTPSAFRHFLEAGVGRDAAGDVLRWIVFAGEALDLACLAGWIRDRGDRRPGLMNMYGITETTVHVTLQQIAAAELEQGASLVGRSMADLRLYLLDCRQQLVPLGAVGEIYVGGPGLARGYLGRPDLTAERFLPDPFTVEPGARMYRSGDLARFNGDGRLEYLGRLDHQVKVRGFRVELSEIDTVLRSCPQIRDAVVVAEADAGGDTRLIGYVSPRTYPAPTVTELRAFLDSRLPRHMAPTSWVFLDALPLNSNGKVDRRSLPQADSRRPELGHAIELPRTTQEQLLAGIWARVLSLDTVGIHDNYFSLGGDSLRSIQVQALAQERGLNVSVQQLFEHQTIAELAASLAASTPGEDIGIAAPFSMVEPEDLQHLPEGIEDAYPLSMMQAGMVFHSAWEKGYAAFHNVSCYRIRGHLDLDAFREAARGVALRHPVLRTSFDLSRFRQPLQLVHRTPSIAVREYDLRSLSEASRERTLAEWIQTEQSAYFDSTRPSLLRFNFHRIDHSTFLFTLSEHHAILDGWSVGAMLTELFERYRALRDGHPMPEYPHLAVSYRQFVELEQRAMASGESRQYWASRLEGFRLTALPRRQPEGREAAALGSRFIERTIDRAISQSLAELARDLAVPLKSVVLAAHLRVLAVISGQTDVTTGLVTSARPACPDGDRLLGVFLNSLPCRLQLHGGSWRDLIRQAFTAEAGMQPHTRYPLARIVQECGGARLFESLFTFVNFHAFRALQELAGFEVLDQKFFGDDTLPLSSSFILDPLSQDLVLRIGYQTADFDAAWVEALAGRYLRALASIAREPDAGYDSVSLLSEQESSDVAASGTRPEGAPGNVCQMFETQVKRAPDAVAIVAGPVRWTFRQLNRRADAVAARLRRAAVGPETRVGVIVDGGAGLVAATLGVLKAGAALVPISPDWTHTHQRAVLLDAGVGLLLMAAPDRGPDEYPVPIVQVGDAPSGEVSVAFASCVCVSPRNTACVVYPADQTQPPRGAVLAHGALASGCRSRLQDCRLGGGGPCLIDLSFSLFPGSLLTGLVAGSSPVILAPRNLPPAELHRLLSEGACEAAFLAPSAALDLSGAGAHLASPGLLVTEADLRPRVDLSHLRKACGAGVRLAASFGLAEVAGRVSWIEFPSGEEPAGGEVLGRPAAGVRLYVLDAALLPAPVGTPGELYVGGSELADGYANRPEDTARAFVPDPFSGEPGARLFRTGAFVRRLSGGAIEYLEREAGALRSIVPAGAAAASQSAGRTFAAPATPLECELASIWTAVLGLDSIGVQDNFFDLGGHSLSATRIIARVRDTLHIEVPIRTLFENPTVAGLAAFITAARLQERGEEAELLLGRLQEFSEEEAEAMLRRMVDES